MAEQGLHRSVWCDHRATFGELTELLSNRMIDLANAGGRIVSVSHAVDHDDPEGAYTLIVVAEAPEEIVASSDIASVVEQTETDSDLPAA